MVIIRCSWFHRLSGDSGPVVNELCIIVLNGEIKPKYYFSFCLGPTCCLVAPITMANYQHYSNRKNKLHAAAPKGSSSTYFQQ